MNDPTTKLDYVSPGAERPPLPPVNRHNQIYTILLIVLAFFYVLSIITITSLRNSPTMPPESRWFFGMTAWIEGAFLAAMVTTLILRATSAHAGRIATKALNIILLILFPFGTAPGIYGLMKVDKGTGSSPSGG